MTAVCEPSLDQRLISLHAQRLYDSWTGSYDRHSLGDCQYQSPDRIAQVLSKLGGALRNPPWLDLGAGTGLVGKALHNSGLSAQLIAVDSSQTMLSHIDHEPYVACAVCSALDCEGLASLRANGAIAVGLSEHIVDLNPLFAACRHALPSGALLIFSYCPLQDEAEPIAMVFESFAGLIAHNPNHVSRALEAYGFAPLIEHDGPGYVTASVQVMHRIVIARRT